MLRLRLATFTVAALTTSLTAALPAASAEPAPADQQRQQAFASASAEFGVPDSVLLGVSYLESRWDFNAGTPSTTAGFGPMHLTDVTAAPPSTEHDQGGADPRGDEARPALHPQPGVDTSAPELHTLEAAAHLAG